MLQKSTVDKHGVDFVDCEFRGGSRGRVRVGLVGVPAKNLYGTCSTIGPQPPRPHGVDGGTFSGDHQPSVTMISIFWGSRNICRWKPLSEVYEIWAGIKCTCLDKCR